MDKSRFTKSSVLLMKMVELGIIDEMTSRVVIDIDAAAVVPIIYTRQIGDNRLLEVLGPLAELEVRTD